MKLDERFAGGYPFALDDFQVVAARSMAAGRSVLVCAPTGAGKTVVGEFGVWLALERGGKAFYTTPLKALSNQKFGDFIARHGAAKVGLLTGDNSINGEAPVVVMTTEVLRNMLYESSPTLDDLTVVVMDEVHYLQDPYRGATWEEIFIHLPSRVQVAALSATVSNAEEFGEWLRSVRGPTDVVIEHERPVPIEHAYMVGPTLHPMFMREDDRLIPNPALLRMRAPRSRYRGRPDRGGKRPREGRSRPYRPNRIEVTERLDEDGLLPAIVFIFSRAGCDQAVEMCRTAGLRLTDEDEAERIREYAEMRSAALPDEDLEALGYERWLEALQRGIAAHHAGMIPLFKETVEELFERALVKAVFATETLALGINMPARTVVIERLMKFTGEKHELLTQGQYTQFTGRAGRRGMDEVGYGITLFQDDIGFDQIAMLASGRSFPLTSSFRPSYNMAVNLLRRYSVEEAGRLLNLSFGQFLADRSVVKQERRIERNERALEGYRQNMVCEHGDAEEYARLMREVELLERGESEEYRRDRASRIKTGFEQLRPGHVLRLRRGLAAVLEVRYGKGGVPQPIVLTDDRKQRRLAARDFPEPPVVVGRITLPRGDPRAPRYRHQVSRLLEQLTPAPERRIGVAKPDPRAREARARVESHPVHACPDRNEHVRWAQRTDTLASETDAMRKRVRRRTATLARMFERVLAVLTAAGYVEDGTVTDRGARLARIYNESDLLVAEALHEGVLEGLDAPDLAAVVSSLVYETRVGVPLPDWPNKRVRGAVEGLERLFRRVANLESDNGLELVREPDPGFVGPIHRWASDASLEEVLEESEMSPGDFVRSTKQVWDLLRQLAELDLDQTQSARCREAARAIYRGVVASSGAL